MKIPFRKLSGNDDKRTDVIVLPHEARCVTYSSSGWETIIHYMRRKRVVNQK